MSNTSFDAIVIGGGIIGVSSAYQLARRGLKRVAILEKGPHVAAGSTGQSSAIGRLMTGIDLPDDPPVDPRYFAANRTPIRSSGGVLA